MILLTEPDPENLRHHIRSSDAAKSDATTRPTSWKLFDLLIRSIIFYKSSIYGLQVLRQFARSCFQEESRFHSNCRLSIGWSGSPSMHHQLGYSDASLVATSLTPVPSVALNSKVHYPSLLKTICDNFDYGASNGRRIRTEHIQQQQFVRIEQATTL